MNTNILKEKIWNQIELEFQAQKASGKKFLSDEVIDKLVFDAINEANSNTETDLEYTEVVSLQDRIFNKIELELQNDSNKNISDIEVDILIVKILKEEINSK